MNKDFYNKLPGLVCFILDELIEKYENEEWFENAWNEYREHILKSDMDGMKMPGAIFNKYEIHNLLKIENDKTTIFTNKELKMIDDYINELEARNKELMKQLEEYKRLGFEHLNDKCNKLENQQKEFINYLTSYIKLLSDDPDYVEERQKDILEEILSEYEEIIG